MKSKNTITPEAILFDLDGVLVDTEGIYTEFWAGIDKIYPTGIADFAHVIKGNTLERILSSYFPSEDMQRDIISRLKTHEQEMRYALFPYVEEFLVMLRAAGVKTAIVTSSSPRKMQNLFNQIPTLRELIDIIITDADVTRSKPDPQGYLLAAKKLGISPTVCIVAEDSFSGLEAGRRSGAKVLGLATTNSAHSLDGKADKIVRSFENLSLAQLSDMF